jgi:hypothetical protein
MNRVLLFDDYPSRAAMEAYLGAIASGTTEERKIQIEAELRSSCALETEAMIRIWWVFSG